MTSSPWRQLSEQTTEISSVATNAHALVQHVAGSLAARGDEYQCVMVQADTARELSAAAARLMHAAQALEVQATALVESSGLARMDAMSTTRSWLARHNGLSHSDAGVITRSAVALERFPSIHTAYVAGDLTLGHLNAVAGVIPSRLRGRELETAIEMVRGVQEILVESAKAMTVEEFRRFCAEIRKRLDTDGTVDRAKEPSRLWLRELFNGRWALVADLSALDGPVIASLLADAVNRRIAAETAAGQTGNENTPGDGETEAEHRSWAERHAEALGRLLFAGAGTDRPGRMALFVHIDVDDLHLDTDDLSLPDLLDTERAHTEAGFDLDDDTLWALMFDTQVTPIYTRTGTPLSYGRSRRLAPFELRRFIAHRDRRCRFPGCDAPPNRHRMHHMVHWENGGETNPSNTVGICNRNHHDHHDRGFTITGNPNRELVVTRPDGSTLDATPAYLVTT